jgi:hypothetical protein
MVKTYNPKMDFSLRLRAAARLKNETSAWWRT